MHDQDTESEAYDRVRCYSLTHPDPVFIHQYVVDAFTAQRATSDTKPIGVSTEQLTSNGGQLYRAVALQALGGAPIDRAAAL